MTCAEARRQLSALDSAVAAEIDAHLEDCAPCRGESESLKEVDRRVVRLGEVRRGVARVALSRDPGVGRASRQGFHQTANQYSHSSLAQRSGTSPSGAVSDSSGAPASGLVSIGKSPQSPQRSTLPKAPSAELSDVTPTPGRFSPVPIALLALALVIPALLWLLFRVRH